MLAVTDWCELENSLLRGFSNPSLSLCIEWRMFRDSSVMLVGSEQFALNHSSLLDSGEKKKKKTGLDAFLLLKGSLEVTFELFSIGLKNLLRIWWALIQRIIRSVKWSPTDLVFLLGAPVMTPRRVHMHSFYLSSQKFICCDAQRPPVDRKGVPRVGALKGLKKLRSWGTENTWRRVYSSLRDTLCTECN